MQSVLRIGILAIMVGATLVGTERHQWRNQLVLIVLYAVAVVVALIFAFSPAARLLKNDWTQLFFTVADVAVLTAFQLLSTGGYVSLLVMALLPILIGLEASWRRAAVVLGFVVLAFGVCMILDPVIQDDLGWGEVAFLLGIFAFLCFTAGLAAYVGDRHTNAIAGLTTLREELLAQTMTASEEMQRRISEFLHDGPLQDVLAARQGLLELQARSPDEELDHALTSLKAAKTRLREATYELHPAVLDQVGVGAAVEQLASSFAARSGIDITATVDYPARTPVDPIVFGVARELLSNIVRHSSATHASVALRIDGGVCHLDVTDDGVGMTPETAAHRLGQGHIGLASHRARVEAAGGRLDLVPEETGTHIRMELPL